MSLSRTRGLPRCLLAFSLFLFFAAAPPHVHAVDIKVRGDMDFTFGARTGQPIGAARKDDNFFNRQRVRLWITMQASEHLQAFAMFRLAPAAWGQQKFGNGRDAGFGLDADGVNLRTRHLFVSYKPPQSNLTAHIGMIPIEVPHAAFYDGILFSVAGGVSLNYKFNEALSGNVFWGRLYNDYLNDSDSPRYTNGESFDDEMDLIGLNFPITLADLGTRITPWGMHARIGKDSGYWRDRVPSVAGSDEKWIHDNATAWWAGFAARSTFFDPLTIKWDFAWGTMDSQHREGNFNTRGWQTVMAADYQLDWGVPGLFGWYASGSKYDDVKNNHQWGHTPIISSFGESFNPTSFGFGANQGVQNGAAIGYSMAGTWGIGAQIADISFVDKLSHTVRLAYYRGTNDKELAVNYRDNRMTAWDAIMLTKDDSVVEVNFDHRYEIYPNLVLSADLGYLHIDQGNEWKTNIGGNAWQAVTNLKYKF